MDIKTSNGMTSRERVLAAARGQPVDRVPVMYWLNPHAACRLMAEFQGGAAGSRLGSAAPSGGGSWPRASWRPASGRGRCLSKLAGDLANYRFN